MKKLLIITIISILAYGCQKENLAPSNKTQAPWIIGKWQMTKAFSDTTVNYNAVNTSIYLDLLTFEPDGTVVSSGSNSTFTYSIANMIVNKGDALFKIKKLTDTTMTLTYKDQYYSLCELFKKKY